MERHTVYLYLETDLHVSGGTSTHHQERIQLYLQHLVFVTPLLLSVAIVEELEPVVSVLWVAYAVHLGKSHIRETLFIRFWNSYLAARSTHLCHCSIYGLGCEKVRSRQTLFSTPCEPANCHVSLGRYGQNTVGPRSAVQIPQYSTCFLNRIYVEENV
jgi:hypothetical protein